MTLAERCRQIEGMMLDVDGVLTAGDIIYNSEGWEIKLFHVRDGSAIKLWQKVGKKLGILSGRQSLVTALRARELGIDFVEQGNANKLPGYSKLLEQWKLEPSQIAYMGDDLPDLPVMKRSGLVMAPADACGDVLAASHFVSREPGGRGAVRSAIETILFSQGLWPLSQE